MADKTACDVLVIGAGPGGYVAAIRAAQLGRKVIVVEKEKLGGVCLNVGCIPSKALIHEARCFADIARLEAMGLRIDRAGFDYGVVFRASRTAAGTLEKGVAHLLRKNGVTVVHGQAELTTGNRVTVDGAKTISAAAIVIATGSRPRELREAPFDEKRILSSTGALMLEKLPKRAVIIGSGAIGMEFGYVWNAFGVEVHMVEMLDRILPLEDDDAAAVLREAFVSRGIVFHTGSKAGGFRKSPRGVAVTLEDSGGTPSEITADVVLVAVGRQPNSAGLGLEKLGIETDQGFIRTGAHYETAVAGVYAIGDCAGQPLLAHLASKQGELVAEHISGRPTPARIDPDTVPSAVYCEPQLAGFGLTERRAKDEKIPYHATVFPYRGVGKAVATGHTAGLVKVLTAPGTDEILGAHVAGADATELIHELLLAKTAELLPEDVADMIHAHPTLSETWPEVMRAVAGKPIHF